MRLVSYREGDSWRPGLSLDGAVFDVDTLLAAAGLPASGSVRVLLEQHGAALPALAERLTMTAAAVPDAQAGTLDTLTLGPPVADPRKTLCIGLNYKDHVAETGRALPTHPDVFAKFATSLIGPHDDIRCFDVSENMDFEGELAIVIGRPCRNVTTDEALGYAAGLMVLNDITARDLQYRGTQWLAGKAVDRSTPSGPELVTLDEIADPQNLSLTTHVNGIEMQSSNTRYMIFPLAELIAYLSSFLTLEPGDIVATGTPQGIGAKRTPPVWLRPGDVVEVDIHGVGHLRNVMR